MKIIYKDKTIDALISKNKIRIESYFFILNKFVLRKSKLGKSKLGENKLGENNTINK